ncbi:MAG: FAD-binding oxidoreductase, partial [Xanthomonadales bacterium]|nr:FAD-binding oxidoreductase [Xanthomonadales bacterium]
MAHAPSYYAASAHPQPERPALVADIEADVCVVGAGYTGLSTALHLAEAGRSVVVLEAELAGWGAS